MKRFLISYWFPLTAGMTATAIFILARTATMGYFAIGGEFLITPTLMVIHLLIRDHLKRKERKNRALRRNQRRAGTAGIRSYR